MCGGIVVQHGGASSVLIPLQTLWHLNPKKYSMETRKVFEVPKTSLVPRPLVRRYPEVEIWARVPLAGSSLP